jgi:hypothetical protein
MLSVNVTISGDKVIIEGLRQMAQQMPKIVQSGLKEVARGVHREAMANLNGKGGFNSYENRTSKSGKQYQKKIGSKVSLYEGFTRSSGEAQSFKRFSDSGGFPVPVRTGNLKRLLDFLDPGQSKEGFSAGQNELVVFNSAEYARTIHEGTGSSAKFGGRPFLTRALETFNQGGQIAALIDNKVNTELKKRGLA